MGFFFYKTLKALLFPPGIFVLILIFLAFLSRKKAGFILGIASAIFLFILSSEVGTIILKPAVFERGDEVRGCSYVVVFGAGVSDEGIRRVMEGCRISRDLGCPLVVSGYKREAKFMGEVAKTLGCEVSIYDSLSKNTYENVKFLRGLKGNLVIVSSDYHIRRIKKILRREGIRADVLGISLPEGDESFLKWLPSYGKFYENLKLLNEIFGMLFLP